MTLLDDLAREPYRFDVLDVLRRFERMYQAKPRIGNSNTLDEEFLLLGQDPFVEFPASNITALKHDAQQRNRLLVRFLGLLGPQGALPLVFAEDARYWIDMRDDSFARFLDIFNHRFIQLFFRAWADARPVAQHDRPHGDRFAAYVGSPVGLGSPAYRERDSIPDYAKLSLAGLLGPKVKSASRLKSALGHLFGVRCDIEEFVGSWLVIEPGDRLKLGGPGSGLGQETLIGSSSYSVSDKFRIHILAKDLDEFERFLPSGSICDQLADVVFFYLGDLPLYEVQLSLPERAVRPARLGSYGRLGWTSWVMQTPDPEAEGVRSDARFHPAEQAALKRKSKTRTQGR